MFTIFRDDSIKIREASLADAEGYFNLLVINK